MKKNKSMSLMEISLWLIPFIFSAFIFAPYIGAIASFAEGKELNSFTLLSLTIFLPLIIIKESSERVKNLFVYLLISVALIGICYFVFSSFAFAGVVTLMAFLRFTARLGGNKSAFDNPHWAGAFAMVFPYAFSAFMVEFEYQLLVLIFALVIFVLALVFGRLVKLQEYILVNKDMYNFPRKRIEKSLSGLIISSFVIILVILALTIGNGFYGVEVSPVEGWDFTPKEELKITEENLVSMEKPAWMISDEEISPIIDLKWLGDTIIIVTLIAFGYFLFLALFRLVRSFNKNIKLKEKNDIIEFIDESQRGESIKNSKISFWDFSINSQVRKRYIKRVKARSKEIPKPWQSPQEIEENAGLEIEKLHNLYEIARYSKEGLSQEYKEIIKKL